MLDFDDLIADAIALLQDDAGGPGTLAGALRARAGRRVPGHRARAGAADRAARGAAGFAVLRRRRGPVHLRLAARLGAAGDRAGPDLPGSRALSRWCGTTAAAGDHPRLAAADPAQPQRFRKPLRPGAAHKGEIAVWAERDRAAGAALVAEWLREAKRCEVVVLARTTTLLREVALACAGRGITFDAAEKTVTSSGARGTLEAYLRLLANPREAAAADVELVFRVPNRSLPPDTAEPVAARLRAGSGFRRASPGCGWNPGAARSSTRRAPSSTGSPRSPLRIGFSRGCAAKAGSTSTTRCRNA